ncbi:uncharacterized protein AKAW2_50099A [Aspergillus luchuensis]|uniref:Uncharacterized protein n=1 Tax=Aspergillus kawachii TaxID=1069201 RepID=A0A7R7WB65_ASPKA|nr:uncharacterized protein AKAW2_50099A [Aspergillus luchuensis]BCR99757.1 hypothetical protein AKAW2_50099A [Aspergillus luchuensis]
MGQCGSEPSKPAPKWRCNRPLVLKNVYFAPQVGMKLISVPKLLRDRYSVVAHPRNAFVQRRGRTVGTAYHAVEDLRDIMNL